MAKTTKVPTKKRGRPKVKVDAKKVKALAAIGCTQDEIATIVGCSVRTLQRNFVAAIKSGSDMVRVSIRRHQLKLALSANGTPGKSTMLIWLGKQYLSQRNNQDVEHTGDVCVVTQIPGFSRVDPESN